MQTDYFIRTQFLLKPFITKPALYFTVSANLNFDMKDC